MVQLYEWLLAKYITPQLGSVQLGKIDTPLVRQWRARLLNAGVSESMAAKAYRLLRAILMTATNEDRILARNPCQIRGAGTESPDERSTLTVAQVFDLASRMEDRRYRAFVLLATFTTLRWGEITALRRRDIAEDASWVRVAGAFVGPAGQGPGVRATEVEGRVAHGHHPGSHPVRRASPPGRVHWSRP
jgi:integrase